MAAVLRPRGDRLPSFSLESERRKRRSRVSPASRSFASAPVSPSLARDPGLHAAGVSSSLVSYFSLPTPRKTLNTSAPLDDDDDDDDDLQFPEYGYGGSSRDASLWAVPPAPSPSEESASEDQEDLSMPRVIVDDSSVVRQPTFRVDYLGHNWREADLWESRRYIRQMKGAVEESDRLEYASWRCWAKMRGRLGTIPPELLHWDKDCDMTWLYGPLQSHDGVQPYTLLPSTSPISSSGSFADRKSILKKRTLSQKILHDSLSSHTLLKQVGAIIEAQGRDTFGRRPSLSRSSSDHVVSRLRKQEASRVWGDSRAHATSESPSRGEGKHISFNNEVTQVIAVDNTGDEDEEAGDRSRLGYYFEAGSVIEDDTSSEDSFLMMGHVPSRHSLSNRSTPRSSFSSDTQIIAPLPSTTLKSQPDPPKPRHQQRPTLQHPYVAWSSQRASISRSSSTETLRPPPPQNQTPDHNFLLDDEDGEAEMQNSSMEGCWGSTSSWDAEEPSSNDFDSRWLPSAYRQTKSKDERSPCPTSSGVFVPFGYGDESESEDENKTEDEDPVDYGLFGRVIDTVNTARDIAHVIWNFPAFSILNP